MLIIWSSEKAKILLMGREVVPLESEAALGKGET